MSGAIPPWRGAQLKKAQAQLYLLPLPYPKKHVINPRKGETWDINE
jgi:hypothetical protein